MERASWLIQHYNNEEIHSYVKINNVIFRQTQYQLVEIIETLNYGRVLLLDGIIQSSERDEFLYHETIVHPALCMHDRPEDVLIIGGGEGAVLREVLKHSTVERVVMVDIDRELVEICKEYLPHWHQGCFDNSKVDLIHEDGRSYIQKHPDSFDCIILDLTDPIEEGPADRLYTLEFYQKVKTALRRSGFLAMQLGPTGLEVKPHHLRIIRTLDQVFSQYFPCYVQIPIFTTLYGFIVCTNRVISLEDISAKQINDILDDRGVCDLKCFDGITFKNMFSIPKHLRQQIENNQSNLISNDEPLRHRRPQTSLQRRPSTMHSELKRYLGRVSRVIMERFIGANVDQQDIIDHYTPGDGASLSRPTSDAIHVALNFDSQLNEEGYYGQANIVQEYIDNLQPARVLELASGRGFNSIYLATRNAAMQFSGIDLNPALVVAAKAKASGMSNLDFTIGNFQALTFPAAAFDMVFVVEGVGHAIDMTKALSEVCRVLKPGGYFIAFEGFRKPSFRQFDKDIQTAARLVEATMAVSRTWMVEDWLTLAQATGFQSVKVDDISEAIMPYLRTWQQSARGYLDSPFVSDAFLRALPPRVVKGTIAGLLLPYTVGAGAHGYYQIVLQRG